ncbi:TPA: DUF551 domain-containing protein [Escherichia coli]|nr:DUF551 domain-containing protein [Escherichia coli]
MTTIIEKRLLTIQRWCETYGPGSNVVLPAEEAEELARIALASLEAEAVSQTNKLALQEWLSEQKEKIDVDCGCVSIETLMHWMKAAYEAGNSPVTPVGLSTVCAEAYQVVGVMADALGVFGDAAVQKVLDNLSQQKLVHRDVLPFSLPVTPSGWISCSEQMPKKNQNVLISVNFDSDLVEPLICSARYTGSTFRRGDATIKPGNGIEQATHWMPLPEPPQESKCE